jgi:hypothetical protein
MEAKAAMEAKAVMESKAAMEAKAAMGKSTEQVSGKGGSDINDGGRLLSLPEADACVQSNFAHLKKKKIIKKLK